MPHPLAYGEMAPGEPFKPQDTVVTEARCQGYQRVAGGSVPLYKAPDGLGGLCVSPLVLMFEWHKLESRGGGRQIGFHAKHSVTFVRPVRLGAKLHVRGWLEGQYRSRGYDYTVAGASLTDEQGFEVMHGFSTVAIQPPPEKGGRWYIGRRAPYRPPAPTGEELRPITVPLEIPAMLTYLREVCGAQIRADSQSWHTSDEEAQRQGLPRAGGQANMLLSYLDRMVFEYTGPRWYQGGALDLAMTDPSYVGDLMTFRGYVLGEGSGPRGRHQLLQVWCQNQNEEALIIGTATVPLATAGQGT